jgi:hypothetical protein
MNGQNELRETRNEEMCRVHAWLIKRGEEVFENVQKVGIEVQRNLGEWSVEVRQIFGDTTFDIA